MSLVVGLQARAGRGFSPPTSSVLLYCCIVVWRPPVWGLGNHSLARRFCATSCHRWGVGHSFQFPHYPCPPLASMEAYWENPSAHVWNHSGSGPTRCWGGGNSICLVLVTLLVLGCAPGQTLTGPSDAQGLLEKWVLGGIEWLWFRPV
jgi:hypothetical protein